MSDIKLIFQDDYLLVLDKPAGLVVEPGISVKEKTLADILQKQFQIKLFRGGVVHRLDKDTSGIILVAKTNQVLENLQAQFKERTIKKEYIVLVHGSLEKGGIVDASIIRNPVNREKFTVVSPKSIEGVNVGHLEGDLAWHPREAVTEYSPEGKFQISNNKFQTIFNNLNKIQIRKLERMRYNQFTLLSCQPRTGRTHQIRVHLKYIGHSIVADEKYTGRKMYRLDKRWCSRMFLHAKRIGFYHPATGSWMELESELPEDLRKALDVLK